LLHFETPRTLITDFHAGGFNQDLPLPRHPSSSHNLIGRFIDEKQFARFTL
jgi:hypothetical protein